MNLQPILAVAGPTASGKTALAVELAKKYGGEVISADSMQIYEGLDIASAKPSREEMQDVPHHLISVIPRSRSFSAAEYVEMASAAVSDIAARGRLPILAGGTGLYIDSLLSGMRFGGNGGDPQLRQILAQEAEEKGKERLHQRLAKLDPEAAQKIHPNNLIRVIRALEVCITTGGTFTDFKAENARMPSPYNARIIGLDFEDREELYSRICKRVESMVRKGLLEEAEAVWRQGDGGTASCAIGYKELIPYFEGKAALAECLDTICRETRRYAKRQLTWFRRNDQILWLKLGKNDEVEEILKKAEKMIAKNEIMWYNEQ